MRQLILPLALLFALPALAQPKSDPLNLKGEIRDDTPRPIPGLTDKLKLDDPKQTPLLGDIYENEAKGISFRAPKGAKPVKSTEPGGDSIADFLQEERSWLLKATQARLARPMPLSTVTDANGTRTGLLDYTVAEILKNHPTAQIMRQEVVNIGEYGVGIAILRFNVGTEKFLRQNAIFQANDRLYYIFNFTTPAAKTGKPEDDPNERLAAETFKQFLDSIQLVDQSWIKKDQVSRLYRTRSLFVDWADKGGKRIREAIVPESWLRIIRDGKDIGYSYVVEEFMEGANVKNNPARAFDGVLISIRTRTVDQGAQVDIGSQLFSSLDRKHEDWAHIVNFISKDPKAGNEKKQNMEFGYSELTIKRVPDLSVPRDPKAGVDPRHRGDPNMLDPKNPVMRDVESYALRVERAVQGRNTNIAPEAHSPSPWYIPQAIGSMLPRLLPLHRAQTYMFQSYVSEEHQVVHRYVDVGFEKDVQFHGQTIRAIPVSDRIRIEGTPTIHYMSLTGKYLGSVNEEAKLVILPTTKGELEKIWKDANLSKQEPIENPPKQ